MFLLRLLFCLLLWDTLSKYCFGNIYSRWWTCRAGIQTGCFTGTLPKIQLSIHLLICLLIHQTRKKPGICDGEWDKALTHPECKLSPSVCLRRTEHLSYFMWIFFMKLLWTKFQQLFNILRALLCCFGVTWESLSVPENSRSTVSWGTRARTGTPAHLIAVVQHSTALQPQVSTGSEYLPL